MTPAPQMVEARLEFIIALLEEGLVHAARCKAALFEKQEDVYLAGGGLLNGPSLLPMYAEMLGQVSSRLRVHVDQLGREVRS